MPISTEVTPLGVSGAIPTATATSRGSRSAARGRVLLFDCGEGTQLQLLRIGLLGSPLEAVFITHLHGDHVYGLPGLVSTLALMERQRPLAVVGPEGVGDVLRAMPGLSLDDLPYEVRLRELPHDLEHETVYDGGAFTVEARPLAHRCPCVGYRYQEAPRPGRFDPEAARAAGVTDGPAFAALARGETVRVGAREVTPAGIVGPERPGTAVAYCLDTAPCDGGRALASGVDLLVHDATFGDEDAHRAEETGHSTARQAAEVARAAGARGLLLTHFSGALPRSEPARGAGARGVPRDRRRRGARDGRSDARGVDETVGRLPPRQIPTRREEARPPEASGDPPGHEARLRYGPPANAAAAGTSIRPPTSSDTSSSYSFIWL